MVKISLEGNALKLQQILLSIFEVQDHKNQEQSPKQRRATFLTLFGRAWANELDAKTNTIWGSQSEDYLNSMLKGYKPISIEIYRDLHEMGNEESFCAWISKYLSGKQWASLQRKLAENGVKITTYQDLYQLLKQAIDDMYVRTVRESKANTNDVTGETETINYEESAAFVAGNQAISSASTSSTLRFELQLKRNHMEFDDIYAALNAYCIAAHEASAHPYLCIMIAGTISNPISLHKAFDGQHHLSLPQSVSAEMLSCPEIYIATAVICHTLDVVVDNLQGDCNKLFFQKISQIRIGIDGYPIPNQVYRLYDDSRSVLSFAIRRCPLAPLIYYSAYDAAQDALADMSWYAALYLVWSNVEIGLNYTVSIGTRKHPNYWGIISNSILMTSTQIRDFLSLHSSGKRTFWGVK